MKKTVSFLLVLGCISAAVSCKKETTPRENVNARSATGVSGENAVIATTKFGALISAKNNDDKITVSQKMGVGYVRNSILLDSYRGKAPMVDNYLDAGFKLLLNLNNKSASNGPNPYPTDMTKYKNSLANVVDDYHPEVAVIENEPINESYYTGPIENYITQLKSAIEVCHARGIKVADGGLHIGMVSILVYQDYLSRGMQKEADDFANRALTSAYLKTAEGKGTTDLTVKLDKTRKQVEAFATMALDYVNFHWYQPTSKNIDDNKASSGVIKEIADYLRRATGKEVLCNEFGQYNQSTSLISSMVSELELANLSYAVVYSGSGGAAGAKPLHNGSNLLDNGVAYRDAIAK
jgi:hypothetical protein